jgi:hypothetical protein
VDDVQLSPTTFNLSSNLDFIHFCEWRTDRSSETLHGFLLRNYQQTALITAVTVPFSDVSPPNRIELINLLIKNSADVRVLPF